MFSASWSRACGERALLEVAADDRNLVDRGDRRHAQAAKRCDQPAARGVGQRQVVDGSREDVGDLLRDQLLGRGHADVDRLAQRADRRRGLLAERGVRLVADHELVRVAGDLADVAREPRVGLDRDRVRVARRGVPLEDRVVEAAAVAVVGQLAPELVDEQAAVREDQDAFGAGGLDEAGGGDRLARRGRVAEAVAADRAGILLDRQRLRLDLLVLELGLRAPPPRAPRPRRAAAPRRCRSRSRSVFCAAAISSVSIPASASTWWRRSSVPEARCGGFSESTRSRPSRSA